MLFDLLDDVAASTNLNDSTSLSDLRGICVQLLKLEKTANKFYKDFAKAWFTMFAKEVDEFTPAHVCELEDRLPHIQQGAGRNAQIIDLVPGDAESEELHQRLNAKFQQLTESVFMHTRPFPPEIFVQAHEKLHGSGLSLEEDGIEILH
jgi:hypothetical protein